jgi:hypothetical protein
MKAPETIAPTIAQAIENKQEKLVSRLIRATTLPKERRRRMDPDAYLLGANVLHCLDGKSFVWVVSQGGQEQTIATDGKILFRCMRSVPAGAQDSVTAIWKGAGKDRLTLPGLVGGGVAKGLGVDSLDKILGSIPKFRQTATNTLTIPFTKTNLGLLPDEPTSREGMRHVKLGPVTFDRALLEKLFLPWPDANFVVHHFGAWNQPVNFVDATRNLECFAMGLRL